MPPISSDGPQPGDLASAVLATLRAAADASRLSEEAADAGVLPEELLTFRLMSLFGFWLAGHSEGVDPESLRLEAERAGEDVVCFRRTALGVRLPALLAVRLAELASVSGRSLEEVAMDLLSAGVDDALRAALRNRGGRDEVRPWSGLK